MQDFAKPYRHHSSSNVKKGFSFVMFFFVTLLLCIAITGFFLMRRSDPETAAIISPLAGPIQETYESIKGAFTSSSLEIIVNNHLAGQQGTYAVVIKHMGNGETYQLNQHHVFSSASLYKLWLMATAYEQIESGKLRPTTFISDDAANLNRAFNIASDSAELSAGKISMSVEDAIEQSIVISHNYSALLLSKKIGISKMTAFLKNEGLTQSKMGTSTTEPVTTANDIALYYEKLYTKKLISSAASDKMIDVLKKQQLNDRIPKYLPQDIDVAHKTGELYGFKHDAGIVFTPGGDYVIVLMSDTKNPANAAKKMAELSKAIYEHFTK